MPSFSIEAPGEVNPLTEQTLLRTLRAASSSNQHQIQSGTKQLQQWEKSEGFYKHLQSVYLERSFPTEVRYLAIIQLKNGIDKYWRKTAANAVGRDDKDVIRSRLISGGLDEDDHRLALQNALVTAKIVRFEYPRDWPGAISSTLDAIRRSVQDTASHRLERALLILLYIIKELSTARIQQSRTNLQAATPEILAVLGSLYVSRVEQWQDVLSADGPAVERIMTQSLLCIKTLRRLIISSYDHPNRIPEVCEFWQITLRQADSLMSLINRESSIHSSPSMPQKHLLQVCKFHLDMAESHPNGFVLLPSSFDLVRAYWAFVRSFSESFADKSTSTIETDHQENGSDSVASTSEKLSLRGLLLIRACIRMAFFPAHTFKYRHDEEKEEKRQATENLKGQLLTQPFVEEVASTIITKLLVLRQSELAELVEDPEEWVLREENEAEDLRLSVRGCAERLVLDLSMHFKHILTGPILSLFHRVADVNFENVLFKDAVYAAIGMAAATFQHEIDFDSLLTSSLTQEVQKQTPGCNIFRRRIAIFCGQWILIKASQDSKAIIYQIFDHLLNSKDPHNDLVVRITAGRHFKHIADDFEFDSAKFAPYAESIIMRLMALIEEVELTATKMALLETISVLIERFEHHIEPFAERIVAILPALWEQSGDEHIMKQSILAILSRLTNALKEQSTRFHAMLFPIIRTGVQPDSPLAPFILEEALDLWQAILVQSRTPTDDLLGLIQHLFPLLTLASETLRETLTVLESYLYLSPSTIMSDTLRLPILNALSPHLAKDANPDANGLACTILELMIRTACSLGGPRFVKQFTSDLISTSVLPQLLESLHSAWSAHCRSTGPRAPAPAVDGIVETDYLALIARLILADVDTATHAIAHAFHPPPEDDSQQEPLAWLLEEWFSHLDNVADPARKKLFHLALTALLDTSHPAVLGGLQLLMTLWTDVVVELCDVDVDPVSGQGSGRVTGEDSLVYDRVEDMGPPGEGVVEAPEDARRRQVLFADEVHRVGAVAWVREKLGGVVARIGEAEFREEWLGRVDGDVVAAFGKLGIM